MVDITRLFKTHHYKYTDLYEAFRIVANNSRRSAKCLQNTLITKVWPVCELLHYSVLYDLSAEVYYH
jgi:hypothetical protein